MTLRTTLLTGASRFAHLSGLTAAPVQPAANAVITAAVPAAAKADDDDMQKQLDEARKRADDAEGRLADAETRAKAAEAALAKAKETDPDDDGDDDTGEDGDDDDDRTDASGKRGTAVAKARSRERARCAAIFAEPAAAANPALAAELAFGADPLPRSAAIAVLKAGAVKSSGLDRRMAQQPQPVLGSDGPAQPGADDPKALAAGVIRAYRIARNIKD